MRIPAPFPMPPALARLHEALERFTEHLEEGFFLAEQDRRGQAGAQPVLMYVAAADMRAAPTPERRPPTWIGEVLGATAGPASDERLARYARAGVREYWRVLLEPDPQVVVHTAPAPDGTYAERRAFAADELVASALFPGLELRPRDLT